MIFDKTKMGRHFALMHFETKDKIDFFEQIIENGQLNLSNCDLEKLPDDFEMFSKKVTSVNLSYNKFDEVPIKALLKLKNLTELKFVNANIWHYPDEIAEISKLETIYVPFSFAQLASANLIAKLNSMQVNIKSAIV
jgi:Leucine-rich repeat (LRR) protein